MRNYRFTDPKSSTGRNRVIGQVVKFIIAWNALGYVVFRYMKNSARELDPDIDNKPSSLQVASMMGFRDMDKAARIRYRISYKDGIQVEKVPLKIGTENSDTITEHNNNSTSDNTTTHADGKTS